MPEFKPGDRVTVRSGGPIMTVAKIVNDGLVRCVWFPGGPHGPGTDPKSHAFEAEALEAA